MVVSALLHIDLNPVHVACVCVCVPSCAIYKKWLNECGCVSVCISNIRYSISNSKNSKWQRIDERHLTFYYTKNGCHYTRVRKILFRRRIFAIQFILIRFFHRTVTALRSPIEMELTSTCMCLSRHSNYIEIDFCHSFSFRILSFLSFFLRIFVVVVVV